MSLTVIQNVTAISTGLTTFFNATGGIPPYVFSVLPGGAGGSINPSNGLYSSPLSLNPNPVLDADTIQAIDSVSSTATASITIGNALILFCDILKNGLGLDSAHCYLWDQKLNQPTDSGLYIAVSVPLCKPFSNIITYDGSGSGVNALQAVNMMATVDLDIISRSSAARDQKEFVLMALQSVYSEQQQEANGFYISKLPVGGRFINLSEIDGAAIPYRYKISFNMQYAVSNTIAVPYFVTFDPPSLVVNP